jgi:hypothetical protein
MADEKGLSDVVIINDLSDEAALDVACRGVNAGVVRLTYYNRHEQRY